MNISYSVGCGRGSNKNSQANIRPQKAEYFILVKHDIGWSASFGPFQKGAALRTDTTLRNLGVQCTYGTRRDALEHDAIGVAILEEKHAA